MRFIVHLREEAATSHASQVAHTVTRDVPGARVIRSYRSFAGFNAYLPEQALQRARIHPLVEGVSQDELIPHDGSRLGSGTQTSAPWHLDRIDEAERPLDGSYDYDESGSGVNIYVIDSGINPNHNDFGSRASAEHEVDSYPGTHDCLGHGTAVASAAVGETHGVAKDAAVLAVRVNDCDKGAWRGDIIAGIEWVTNNNVQPAVAVLSFSPSDNLFHDVSGAVADLINDGVMLVTSAGNNSQSACNEADFHSQNGVMVVAGLQSTSDARVSDSNYGSCVDFFAPGQSVLTADWDSNSTATPRTGTSYAAPLAAGVVANYLEQYPSDGVTTAHSSVRGSATLTSVSGSFDSPEAVLFNKPPHLTVSWEGEEAVHPDDFCTWFGRPRGGRAPYSYSWSGALSGSGKNVSGSPGSSGYLTIQVWDSSSQTDSYQDWVIVDSANTPACPE